MAVYVVDSWGIQNKHSLIQYLSLAHKHLNPGIALGYHGHNNLMQVFGVAEAFVEHGFERDIILDGSVYGIGRGAGNLNIEVFAKYLNEYHGKNYNIDFFLKVYETYLKPIYKNSPWGYSVPLFLSAKYNCNPEYGVYYGYNLKLDAPSMNTIFHSISLDDKIQFQKETADKYAATYNIRTGV
jgi:4-hydroxy 2-oxovalerate aldolase